MPSDTATPKKAERGAPRNRKGRKGPSQAPPTSNKVKSTGPNQNPPTPMPTATPADEDEDERGDVCHICAESMDKKAYAVAECNHRTCHSCALRLRALYKRLDCTFCKVIPEYGL